ncbi:MFS transporter [Agromyces sp. NPDC049794]|uniref:MFS transporter n=1 Tax=unclassified Agromyces TaxID=2639701 RepID=UPI0033FCD47D
MIPAGLLPALSSEFDIPAAQVGLLVSVWSATIIVSSLPVVRLAAGVDRRTFIVAALVVMAAANVVTALAPTFEVALGARVVGAIAHGAFWSIVMVYATSLVDQSIAGRTVALVSAGASGATVLGIPLGTLVGQVADWRLVFGGLAAVLAIVAVLIQHRLPKWPGAGPAARGERRRDRSLPPVMAAAIACLLTAAASFTLFTYIAPYVTDVAGLPASSISPILLAFGAAGIAGLVIAALTTDRWPVASLVVMSALFTAALAALGIAPHHPTIVVVAVAAWGLAIGGLPAMLQSRLLGVASPALRATASALMVVFFNAGIAIGATLGGVLELGAGLIAAAFAAAGLAALATAAVVISRLLAGR